MRRLLSFVMVMSLSVPLSTVLAAAAPRPLAQAAGSISGKAAGANGQALGNASVRLRNLADGQIASTTTTTASGEFSFTALPAGNYTIEVVNAAGEIVGTSATTSLAAGASVTGVTITSSAVTTLTTIGGTTASFLASTSGLIAIAGAGAALAAITVAANQSTASPSQ